MAYVYMTAIPPGGVANTEPLVIDLPMGRRLINLDFDEGGRLVGIEIEGARANPDAGRAGPGSSVLMTWSQQVTSANTCVSVAHILVGGESACGEHCAMGQR